MTSTLRPTDQAALDQQSPRDKRSFWRDNALSIASFGAFLVFVIAMTLTGWHQFNADQLAHHGPTVSLGGYLGTGHFFEALFENWESEFLQMGAYVVLTAYPHPARLGRVEEGRRARRRRRRPPCRRPAQERAVAGAQGRHLARALRELAGDRVHRPVPRVDARARARRRGGVQRRASCSHGEHAVSTWAYFDERAVLVRVVPELAERVPGRRSRSSCCRSSSASGARPSRSRWRLPIIRRAPEAERSVRMR